MRIARIAARLIEGGMFGQPFVLAKATGENWAGIAVVGALEILIALDPAEEGEQLVKAPAVVAGSSPGIIIFGHAAQKDVGIDRGRTAYNLATRYKHGIGGRACLRHIAPAILGGNPKGTRPQTRAT